MSQQPSNNKIIAIYIRVSSAEQAQNKEGSLPSQEQRCREFLKYKLGDVKAIVYREEGKSAKDTNRPEYKKLISDIRCDRIQAVVCTEISRISRSTVDFLQFHDLCKEYGVDFFSLREQVDTTTSHGRLFISFCASWAQFEREQISERTSANLQARARRGLYNGGYVYGYVPRTGHSGYMDVHPDEAAVVQLIFKKYLELGSYCDVAKWLNSQGYRTRQYTTRTGKLKPGAKWYKNSVVHCLKNPIYIGKQRLKDGSIIDGVWEAIISEDLWNRVHALLARNYKTRSNTMSPAQHIYIFGGLIRCMHCNVMLENGSGTGNQGQKVYFYYRHPTGRRRAGCPCPTSLPAPDLEELIIGDLSRYMYDADLAKMICEEYSKLAKEQQRSIQKQIDAIDRQLKKLDDEAAAIVQRIHVLPEPQVREFIVPRLTKVKEQKTELQAAKDALTSQLFHVTGEIMYSDEVMQTFSALLKDFWVLSEMERKELVSILVDRIEMHDRKFLVWIRVSSENSEDTLSGCPVRVSSRTFPVSIPFKISRQKFQIFFAEEKLFPS